MKVFDLELPSDHYYIKTATIVEKITFNNRTFYAKFKRIEEPLTPLLFTQHLKREYTIAVPLTKNNRTDYLVIEYKGSEYQRFYHLIQHLFKSLEITNYSIYQGKYRETLQVFIKVKHLSVEEAERSLEKISQALTQQITKNWKCLPSSQLPEAYNIITLPYKLLT